MFDVYRMSSTRNLSIHRYRIIPPPYADRVMKTLYMLLYIEYHK